MIRLVLVWAFISAVLGVVFHVHGGWVWIFAAPLGILFLGAYTVGGLKTQCPRCGARVKIGFDTCRFCGWTAHPT
jgi:hypothetical protein